jgi:hypothetical protein
VNNSEQFIKNWWQVKRRKYNIGLILAGVTAFILYTVFASYAFYDEPNFEITLFTIIFQGIGYLIMMAFANLFYNLGAWVDRRYNNQNSESFRQKLYNTGFYFSISIPFLIPLFALIMLLRKLLN